MLVVFGVFCTPLESLADEKPPTPPTPEPTNHPPAGAKSVKVLFYFDKERNVYVPIDARLKK